MKNMSNPAFAAVALIVTIGLILASFTIQNDYFFSAGYRVLMFIILATAWNILGGYTGYVNFGIAGFFAIGAYSTVVCYKLGAPILVSVAVATLAAGIAGYAGDGLQQVERLAPGIGPSGRAQPLLDVLEQRGAFGPAAGL